MSLRKVTAALRSLGRADREELEAEIGLAKSRLRYLLGVRRLADAAEAFAAAEADAPAPALAQAAKPSPPPRPAGQNSGRPPSEETIEARRQVLMAIGRHGPAAPKAVAERSGVALEKVYRVLAGSPWFESEPDGWHLTADGQSAWNAIREKE